MEAHKIKPLNVMPEIELDANDRWWVSRLNQLAQVQQGIVLPRAVRIRDCTLREGEETPGTRLTTAQKLSLAREIERQQARFLELTVGESA